jgi:hypothetical protein
MAEIVEFNWNCVLEEYDCEQDDYCGDKNGRYVRESDSTALLKRHRRLVHRAECALPWVESVTEYHELEAALAEEVEDGC